MRIASEGAYAPWNYIDDAGNLAGFEIDLGNELCKRAALECVWIQNDWDTMIPNLIAGNYDAIMAGMSITDERKQTIDFTQNYNPPTPSTFIVPAGLDRNLRSADGPPHRHPGRDHPGRLCRAALQRRQHARQLRDRRPGASPTSTPATSTRSSSSATYLAEVAAGSNGALKLAPPEIPIGDGVGVGLRKADDELETKFNDAITAMKADGTLDALIVKWFPEQGPDPYYAELDRSSRGGLRRPSSLHRITQGGLMAHVRGRRRRRRSRASGSATSPTASTCQWYRQRAVHAVRGRCSARRSRCSSG